MTKCLEKASVDTGSVRLQVQYDVAQMERLRTISELMAFMSRMPSMPFMTKDKAYEAAGCDPRTAMFPYSFQ